MSSQVGAGLQGVTYILDEPSIGLHPRDLDRLLDALIALRDKGNTVIVVEHDPETMRRADYIIEVGPGAGRLGGEVVAAEKPKNFFKKVMQYSIDNISSKFVTSFWLQFTVLLKRSFLHKLREPIALQTQIFRSKN